MALATSLTSASFISQRKAFQEFQPMAGVLPTPLFTAVVGTAHSIAKASQSRILSPRRTIRSVRARGGSLRKLRPLERG